MKRACRTCHICGVEKDEFYFPLCNGKPTGNICRPCKGKRASARRAKARGVHLRYPQITTGSQWEYEGHRVVVRQLSRSSFEWRVWLTDGTKIPAEKFLKSGRKLDESHAE